MSLPTAGPLISFDPVLSSPPLNLPTALDPILSLESYHCFISWITIFFAVLLPLYITLKPSHTVKSVFFSKNYSYLEHTDPKCFQQAYHQLLTCNTLSQGLLLCCILHQCLKAACHCPVQTVIIIYTTKLCLCSSVRSPFTGIQLNCTIRAPAPDLVLTALIITSVSTSQE